MLLIDSEIIKRSQVEFKLSDKLKEFNKEERVVILHVDKDVPVEHLVDVASICAELNARISIATKPE